MSVEPWQLVSWGWAAGLALFGVGAPLVILWSWAHALLTRHRNLTSTHLMLLDKERAETTEDSPA